jgi:hypothetical protein
MTARMAENETYGYHDGSYILAELNIRSPVQGWQVQAWTESRNV